MTLPIVLFLVFGVLFGLATYSNRHHFSEGTTRQVSAAEKDPMDSRLAWTVLCSCLWPLMALTGAYSFWRRRSARVSAHR
jgi:hypothetical protein